MAGTEDAGVERDEAEALAPSDRGDGVLLADGAAPGGVVADAYLPRVEVPGGESARRELSTVAGGQAMLKALEPHPAIVGVGPST